MNKHSVNIVSLVILLSLICFIMEACLYYFIPQHIVTIGFAALASLLLSHFFLEASLNYDYNFIHSVFMVISTILFGIVVYMIQPNVWITYDFCLVILVLVNWLIPFIYCCIRDILDKGPRFDGYHKFFNKMNIFFIIIYLLVLAKQYFLTPIIPPYEEMAFGAHNFIPFMATGIYIENSIKDINNILQMCIYMAEIICMGIPFGYFARIFCRKVPFLIRILIYLAFPALLEGLQYTLKLGRCDIDDYVLSLIGILIGLIIFHIMNFIYQITTSRDFTISRTKRQKYLH